MLRRASPRHLFAEAHGEFGRYPSTTGFEGAGFGVVALVVVAGCFGVIARGARARVSRTRRGGRSGRGVVAIVDRARGAAGFVARGPLRTCARRDGERWDLLFTTDRTLCGRLRGVSDRCAAGRRIAGRCASRDVRALGRRRCTCLLRRLFRLNRPRRTFLRRLISPLQDRKRDGL